jgi:hypothetical protein
MRSLLVALVAVAVVSWAGCASSTNASDGGADMAAGMCDRSQLFVVCSQQCGFHVCGIGSVTCDAGQLMCDCTQAVACNDDGGRRGD